MHESMEKHQWYFQWTLTCHHVEHIHSSITLHATKLSSDIHEGSHWLLLDKVSYKFLAIWVVWVVILRILKQLVNVIDTNLLHFQGLGDGQYKSMSSLLSTRMKSQTRWRNSMVLGGATIILVMELANWLSWVILNVWQCHKLRGCF